MNRLEPILARTRQDVAQRKAAAGLSSLESAASERMLSGDTRSFMRALRRPGLSIIAEHKRSSPSAGSIREDLELEDVVTAYEQGGAAALSILTEPHSFGGSLADLRRARAATSIPLLRKDFIVDSFQILEAFAFGADAVLLIVAALSERTLVEFRGQALEMGLPALVEVHDREELEVAVGVGAELIGINNRDLTTLEVDGRRTFSMLDEVPPGTTVVAESGFSTAEQLLELAEAGVDAVLIGEALMRAADIRAACRALLETRRPGA